MKKAPHCCGAFLLTNKRTNRLLYYFISMNEAQRRNVGLGAENFKNGQLQIQHFHLKECYQFRYKAHRLQ